MQQMRKIKSCILNIEVRIDMRRRECIYVPCGRGGDVGLAVGVASNTTAFVIRLNFKPLS